MSIPEPLLVGALVINIKEMDEMTMRDMFKLIESDEVLDLEKFQTNESDMVILRQFLYNVGDSVILRDEIREGTYCGGVEFDNHQTDAKGKVLTVKDAILNEYGNYYITEELEDNVFITDTMIDQLKTKACQAWERENQPLICIIGRTASGKDTFASTFVDEHSTLIKSYTTRPRREGEGETHKFIDSIEGYSNRWVETEINGYNYFVLEEDVLDNDVLIVDPVGFYSLMSQPEFTREVEVYYLMVDPLTRLKRYTSREKTSVEDFIQRNGSEDEQFNQFEKMIQNSYFREEFNIRVFTSETRLKEPFHRELHWDGTFCGDRMVGGWVTNKDKVRPINPIEKVNDYIEFKLTNIKTGGDSNV